MSLILNFQYLLKICCTLHYYRAVNFPHTFKRIRMKKKKRLKRIEKLVKAILGQWTVKVTGKQLFIPLPKDNERTA